ncbi:MAG: Maf family protein [Nitrospinaceae bacterium]
MTETRKPIILASQSPRRLELLRKITSHFKAVPSAVEEILRLELTPEENALALARQKARNVAGKFPGHCVIGADTLVVLDGEIIGKPTDTENAHRILRRLSGKEHQVITGVAVVNSGLFEETVTSKVHIRPLTNEEISRYIASGEPMDKAGAYAIQGRGAFMVASFKGSFSNIVGLPLDTVRKLLRQAGCAVD